MSLKAIVEGWLQQQKRMTDSQIESTQKVCDSQIESQQRVTVALIDQSSKQTEALMHTADNLARLNKSVDEAQDIGRKHTGAILAALDDMTIQSKNHSKNVAELHTLQIDFLRRMCDRPCLLGVPDGIINSSDHSVDAAKP